MQLSWENGGRTASHTISMLAAGGQLKELSGRIIWLQLSQGGEGHQLHRRQMGHPDVAEQNTG